MISLDVQLKDCAYVEEGSVMISHKNLLTLRWSQSTPCYRMILPLGPEIKFANWFQEKKGQWYSRRRHCTGDAGTEK